MTHVPDQGMCQETSGFLFSHRCGRFAVQACMYCGKALCEAHAHPGAEGVACTSCMKQRPKDESEADKSNRPARDDDSDDDNDSWDDSPYSYGERWYPGYGSSGRRTSGSSARARDNVAGGAGDFDPNDFTEGDAESLRTEGDEAFETEMGES